MSKQAPWARPVEHMMGEEEVAARANIEYERNLIAEEAGQMSEAARAQREREASRSDAVKQRSEEAKACRAAMNTGLGLLVMAGQIGRAFMPLVKKLEAMLHQMAEEEKISPEELLGYLERIVKIANGSTSIVGQAMELDRKRLGQPEKLIGVQPASGDFFSYTKALEILGSEEEVQAAILEMSSGDMTDRAAKLIEAMEPLERSFSDALQ